MPASPKATPSSVKLAVCEYCEMVSLSGLPAFLCIPRVFGEERMDVKGSETLDGIELTQFLPF